MKVSIEEELTYDMLMKIWEKGISGGDKNDLFSINRIGDQVLDNPIEIPHYLYHMLESAQRMKWAINNFLTTQK